MACGTKRSYNHMHAGYVYSGHMKKQKIPLGIGSRQYKTKALKAAADFGYPKEVISAIENTNDYEEIARIMERAGKS